MTTQELHLTTHHEEFITTLVASGQYQDAGDVIRDGLRLLERRRRKDRQKLELLEKLCGQGIAELDQGQGIALNGEPELTAHLEELGRRARQKHAKGQ